MGNGGIVSLTVVVTREYNQEGLWYVAQSGDVCAQVKNIEDVQYEFERMLIGAQAIRGELLPRQYQITYMMHTTVNVLSDGLRVTGWADEEGEPIDDVTTEGKTNGD